MPKKNAMCKTSTKQEFISFDKFKGSSNNNRQLFMYVVKKNGFIILKILKSIEDKIINAIMITIVRIIGVTELSVKDENKNASDATVDIPKIEKPNDAINLHKTSFSEKI